MREFLNYHNPVGKIIYLFCMLALLIPLVMLSVFYYWSSAPYKILDIKKLPIPIEGMPIQTGRSAVFIFDYCKLGNYHGVVQRQMISSKVTFMLPDYVDTSSAGCQNDVRVPVTIPLNVIPDTYRIHYKITYRVNPLRNIVVEFDTVKFVTTL